MSADNKHQDGRRPGPNKGQPRAKRDPILDLAKYSDKRIRVKFMGGREGYDQLLNLVLDETEETMKATENAPEPATRSLGLLVCRGPAVIMLSPLDGSEQIENPFLQPPAA
ncbi:U6 snRNP-associated protein Lsm7 [Dimargaris verticillata]|uniref:U6 snRNP-associated protein Lsm7 n=1 Tax=Dimargaris verticillata TaxID=2761393 RepID=A0A9W8EAP4_9FUNG|nr:U6 snRNP-associated protein Lsm7 [Dimargaris verticillata]